MASKYDEPEAEREALRDHYPRAADWSRVSVVVALDFLADSFDLVYARVESHEGTALVPCTLHRDGSVTLYDGASEQGGENDGT